MTLFYKLQYNYVELQKQQHDSHITEQLQQH